MLNHSIYSTNTGSDVLRGYGALLFAYSTLEIAIKDAQATAVRSPERPKTLHSVIYVTTVYNLTDI